MPMLTYPTKLICTKNIFNFEEFVSRYFCQVQTLKFQRVYSYGSSVDIFGNLSRHSRTSRPFFIFIPSTTNILCSIDSWVDQSQN